MEHHRRSNRFIRIFWKTNAPTVYSTPAWLIDQFDPMNYPTASYEELDPKSDQSSICIVQQYSYRIAYNLCSSPYFNQLNC
jgi:hypothetical protein